MIDLPEGTMVEVMRSRTVSEIMVLEKDAKLPLRRASSWERFRFFWRMKRRTANEISAAAEAILTIDRAKIRKAKA